MSENLGNTQPTTTITKTKNRRGRAFLFNALGLIIILFLAVFAGYGSGINIRKNTESSVISRQLGDQFQSALVDIQFGKYENAQERLQWIISKDPTFPGAQEKLTEVLVLQNVPTPTITPSLTPTPDFSGAEQAFLKAQQLITAQDWPGAIGALDEIRKLDSTYKTSLVDGMYYFALRNYGYDLIVKQGNLEGGIYQFTLAERFGPLDRDATALREGARYFLIGASFWELNWEQAVFYFSQVYAGYPGLWDGTSTAADRFRVASMRYGDDLVKKEQYCDAVAQYQNAQAISALDAAAQEGYNRAYNECYPPTATIDLTLSAIPPTAAVTDTSAPPTQAPTEPPTAAPTAAPTTP